MKIKILLLSGLMVVLFSACKKYLDPYPDGGYTSENIYEYSAFVQGLVGQCYEYLPTNYNDNEGAFLDGATDNGVITSSTYNLRRFATGTLTTGQDPFLTYWDRDYKGIYLANKFLEGRKCFNTRLLVDRHLDLVLRRRLQGEAFALRAWFQWDLLQKFGGKGVNGEMLGFPIITDPVDVTKEINLKRDSYDDCVKQIIADCDSAYKYLPIAHRDFLTATADLTYLGSRCWGRFDGITTRAIKANVFLTWASPRFNPDNDISRWDSAAVNAKKVMDFKLNVDGAVAGGFKPVDAVNWFNPNFPGIVIAARYLSANEAMERMFYPGGFQGNGQIGASQELVDAFPMKSGYPITDEFNRGGYDELNPYINRDPRFYNTIFYNSLQVKKNYTGGVMYTFENWANGGKDASGAKSTNSLTNYHIKKFVFMGLNWSDASVNRQPHSRFHVRWAHMCLAFAEAANHVAGPIDNARYGISARTAIQYLRSRKTLDGSAGISSAVPGTADLYLTEVASKGEAAFDELVKNERRIETCFEGMRFYDIRRWTTDLTELNRSVHGAYIVKNDDNSFTYNLRNKVEDRAFSSAFLPIPYSEILRMSNLVQNEGWDGWN